MIPNQELICNSSHCFRSLNSSIRSVAMNDSNDTLTALVNVSYAAAALANYTVNADILDQPSAWQTWVVGLGFISLCSFSAPVGMLLLPCLPKWLYERIMSLLISVGIGALSGSCFFIMVPQAFALSNPAYSQKSWIIVGSLYAFLLFDRMLQYAFELKRRRSRRSIHISDDRRRKDSDSMRSESTAETSNDTADSAGDDISSVKSGKLEHTHEIDISSLRSNIVARTLSMRRRVGVVRVDEIEFEGSEGKAAPEAASAHPARISSETLRQLNNELSHMGDISTAMSAIRSDVHNGGICENHDNERICVQVVEKLVIDRKDLEIAAIAYILIVGSSVNNFLDGMSMGAAFADSLLRGVSIGISSFAQQFPQEVGTLAILANSGLGLKRTMLVNLIPVFLSYFGFAAGVILDNIDESYDNYVFSVSAGMYLYVFLGTLVPEVRETTEELIKTNLRESLLVTVLQFIGMATGVTFMYFMNKINDIK